MNSRVVKIEHLRTFFDYLFTIKHSLFTEPFKKIKCERKIEQKLPNYLSLDEAKKVLNVYSNSSKTTDIRNNAMIHIFLNCGLRLSEVSNLNIDDINMNDDRFIILGKGNKERTGYLNEPTKKVLQEYLDIRKSINVKTKALFLSNYNRRISATSIKRIVKNAYSLADINNNEYSAHTLRHTCATLLYINGTDIKVIQELLGHVQIDTTEIYTHLHDEEVMNAMLGHPLSQFKMDDALGYCAA